MKDQLGLFLSIYFSDIESIKKLLNSKEDLLFTVNVPEGYFAWQSGEFRISAVEIILMTLDCWDDLKKASKLEGDLRIKPEKIYLSTLQSLQFVTQKFPELKTKTIAYENYIGLSYALLPDEEYFTENEFEEYLLEGYKRVDLELINAGARKNIKKVRHLMELGANPMIDPDDKTDDSLILTILSDAEAFNLITYLEYYQQFIESGKKSFKGEDIYPMISHLYTAASSSKLYKLISSFTR